MNDGRYQPFNQEIFDTYHKNMTTLIGRIEEAGAVPILMTPTMYDSRAALARKRAPAQHYNSVLTYYGTWLREVAVNKGFGFVDMWGPLNNLTLQKRKTDPAFTMIRDAVHPDPPGQLVMAYSIIDNMGLRGGVSNIRVVETANGKPRATARGGKITDFNVTDDALEFTFQANSLPWILPEEAQQGADLLKLGHRASQEGLEVHVLPAGTYSLSIDGETVGEYTSVQLERHIELQSNNKTPQYQQAAQVAELNKQRNTGPIGQLRREWSIFQRFARERAALKDAPNDEKRKETLAKLETQMNGREDRIVEFEKAARKIEDQIFEINQPKPRKYVLKRVAG